jgi:phosphatidylserine decarboxylase
MNILNQTIYVLLWLLPKNLASAVMGRLVSIKFPKQLQELLNEGFCRLFGVNKSESAMPVASYPSIQALFIRRLATGARPIASEENVIISPGDGVISVGGPIGETKMLQAKGRDYSVADLVLDREMAAHFKGGDFFTLYLSPKDYHRFHMPITGRIEETLYVPGALWPVNTWAVNNIGNLFCVNERIITLVACPETAKKMAVVAVGACMVGKIELAYLENYKTCLSGPSKTIHGPSEHILLKKGDELGRFMFGSTIILLFEPGFIKMPLVEPPRTIKMGEGLAVRR